mgnify:CR=1 FL=1
MAVKRHTLDIYGVELNLATNRRDWATMRRRLTWLAEKPTSAGLCSFATWHPKGGGATVPMLALWVDVANHEPIELVETCAHEAAHAAGQMLDYLGHDVRGTGGTDEPHAYLVGWLTRWMFEGCADA